MMPSSSPKTVILIRLVWPDLIWFDLVWFGLVVWGNEVDALFISGVS